MTLETSRRLMIIALWASITGSLASMVLSLGRAQYGQARVEGALVAGGLILVWALERVDVWCAAILREATAKASFAEHLLSKIRHAEGLGVEMEFSVEKQEGTKH